MTLLAERNGATVFHCTFDALPVDTCDLLCVDAPYSERTHSGHDSGVSSIDGMKDYAKRNGGQEKDRRYAERKAALGLTHRRELSYSAWSSFDVEAFVSTWSPRTKGWFLTITDHVLAPVWESALTTTGRYVFAPIACVAPGSRVRMTGDGPTNWSCWLIAARPRTPDFIRWGSLPGAYVLPSGMSVDMPIVGGKQPWLLQRLVEDYSRPGDLVVDPCCGAGTTAIGAIRSGRRAVVGDCNEAHAKLAALWVAHPHRPAPSLDEEPRAEQPSLFPPGAR